MGIIYHFWGENAQAVPQSPEYRRFQSYPFAEFDRLMGLKPKPIKIGDNLSHKDTRAEISLFYCYYEKIMIYTVCYHIEWRQRHNGSYLRWQCCKYRKTWQVCGSIVRVEMKRKIANNNLHLKRRFLKYIYIIFIYLYLLLKIFLMNHDQLSIQYLQSPNLLMKTVTPLKEKLALI